MLWLLAAALFFLSLQSKETMNHKDVARGSAVYHNVMVHRGKGVIIEIKHKDLFGYKRTDCYHVQWEDNSETWERISQLRRSHNTARIRSLLNVISPERVEFKQRLERMLLEAKKPQAREEH